jgi:hypothetical protein
MAGWLEVVGCHLCTVWKQTAESIRYLKQLASGKSRSWDSSLHVDPIDFLARRSENERREKDVQESFYFYEGESHPNTGLQDRISV